MTQSVSHSAVGRSVGRSVIVGVCVTGLRRSSMSRRRRALTHALTHSLSHSLSHSFTHSLVFCRRRRRRRRRRCCCFGKVCCCGVSLCCWWWCRWCRCRFPCRCRRCPSSLSQSLSLSLAVCGVEAVSQSASGVKARLPVRQSCS